MLPSSFFGVHVSPDAEVLCHPLLLCICICFEASDTTISRLGAGCKVQMVHVVVQIEGRLLESETKIDWNLSFLLS